ncbi:MAG: iron chelate uptake ABC transporter family permease subunit [bacterium]
MTTVLCAFTPAAPARPPEEQGSQRVVSLAPNLTEIVCAIGGAHHLVGRTSVCNYPPEALKDVPVVGGFGDPSLEKLLEVRPTLVLDVALADEALSRKIEEIGLRRERIVCGTLNDIPDAVTAVGALIGHEAEARTLAGNLRAMTEAFRKASRAVKSRPRVYVEIWCDPLTTAGKASFVSELVAAAGGENIGDGVDKDYFQVGPEWVLEQNPDVILCLYMTGTGEASSSVFQRSEWSRVNAVRTGRVYSDLDSDLVLRPGPRVLQGITLIQGSLFRSGAVQGTLPDGQDMAGASRRLQLFRVLAAFIVGAALACAGIVLQALLKNPLAEPYVLGVSSGAALGAALAIVGGLATAGAFVLPAVAFAAGAATLALVYVLSRSGGQPSIYGLIISGVIVSSVCSSILMFILAVTPVEGIHSILWWMLGNLQVTSYPLLEAVSILVVSGIAVIWLMSPELNALTLGQEMAHYVGIRTKMAIPLGLAMATLITAAAVAMTGLIGFIGLIVPHVVRNVVGPDHRRLIPAAALAGGVFLALCDLLARTVIAPVEIPVGVITALLGGPFFLIILRSRRKGGWIG